MHLDYNSNANNEFKLDGIILDSIVTEKDLGLTVSHNLKWDSYIKLCIKDANRAICWISINLILFTIFQIFQGRYKTESALFSPKLSI